MPIAQASVEFGVFSGVPTSSVQEATCQPCRLPVRREYARKARSEASPPPPTAPKSRRRLHQTPVVTRPDASVEKPVSTAGWLNGHSPIAAATLPA